MTKPIVTAETELKPKKERKPRKKSFPSISIPEICEITDNIPIDSVVLLIKELKKRVSERAEVMKKQLASTEGL